MKMTKDLLARRGVGEGFKKKEAKGGEE